MNNIGWFCLGLVLAFGISGMYFSIAPAQVDVDCLVDFAEQTNVKDASLGYLHGNWTLDSIRWFYDSKQPKSRFAVKQAIRGVLLKCQE